MHPSASHAQPPRILVVEDDRHLRATHEQFFRGYGYEVTVCRTGREALAHLATGDISVMLLELAVPEVSGYEVLAAMRRGEAPRVPVVVVSAVPAPLLNGVQAVFPKPAPMMEVLAAVQRQLH